MKLQKETKAGQNAHGKWYNDACGTAFAMEVVGERWALLVLRELMLGPRRFSDLRASLPGISAKVLTERLANLESAGVLVKRQMEPPVAARVYELTEWGYLAEPLIQELGRWAAMSGDHDPTLPLSPVSFMLSLRTMFDPAKAAGQAARIGFRFPGDRLVGELADGVLVASRGPLDGCDAVFDAAEAPQLAAIFYGTMVPEDVGVSIEGDREAALRFAAIFELPAKMT